MILIALTNVNDPSFDFLNFEKSAPLPKKVIEKIQNTKNENEKRLRLGAYSSLLYLYQKITDEKTAFPDIEFSEKGKPYFTNTDNIPCPVFSISHDGEYSAVAVSKDFSSVGIDIQKMPSDRERLERVSRRFLNIFKKGDTVCADTEKKRDTLADVEYIFLNISKDGEIVISNSVLCEVDGEKYGDLKDWTVLEASLKNSGGGFSDYEDAQKIIEKVRTGTKVFLDNCGGIYSVSIAAL